jgi:hypothetical protein
MSDLSEELTLILAIVWWLQNSVRKRVSQKVGMERFNLKKLNDVEVKQCQVKFSNKFASLDNLDSYEMSISVGLGKVLQRI